MPDIKWYRRVEQKAKSVSTTIIAIEDGIQAAAFEKVSASLYEAASRTLLTSHRVSTGPQEPTFAPPHPHSSS